MSKQELEIWDHWFPSPLGHCIWVRAKTKDKINCISKFLMEAGCYEQFPITISDRDVELGWATFHGPYDLLPRELQLMSEPHQALEIRSILEGCNNWPPADEPLIVGE